jgi:type VI protein secretion system component Hcp
MIELKFLKLEGLRGPSDASRHIGDIPIHHYSFGDQPIVWGSGSLPVVPRRKSVPNSRGDFSYLLIDKGADETTTPLRMAWTNGRKFVSGELVIEQVTNAGHLIRTTTFKMRSIVVDAWSNLGHRDTIGLKFESMSVAR